MQTVLYVSPMTTGSEVEIRHVQETFPVELLDRGIGVDRVVAFLGSGFYALEITVSDGDFQEQFHRFLETPEITSFFERLSPFVSSLPSTEQTTGEMPLLAAAMLWQSEADRASTA